MNDQVSSIRTELLVLACQSGDAEALALLFRQWSPPLERYVYRVSGDRDSVPDVVQETWLAVIRGINRLADAATFRSWIYTIAHNKCRDWQRKQRLQQRPPVPPRFGEPAPVPPSTDDKHLALETCLMDLDEEDRALIALYYFDEMSVREISEILGIPEGTVKSRLHRCRQELRKRMEEYTHER
jgi:RNA polymerase sigma factor (sigma-70 family)